jgi:hypothetical protein
MEIAPHMMDVLKFLLVIKGGGNKEFRLVLVQPEFVLNHSKLNVINTVG